MTVATVLALWETLRTVQPTPTVPSVSTRAEVAQRHDMAGLRERKKDATRRALAETAMDLAQQRGYHGVTIADITICWLPRREMSLPSPTACRVRASASACVPSMTCAPAGSARFE